MILSCIQMQVIIGGQQCLLKSLQQVMNLAGTVAAYSQKKKQQGGISTKRNSMQFERRSKNDLYYYLQKSLP